MEPIQPPQDSPPPQQGRPAPGPAAGPGPYHPGPYTPYGPGAGLGPGPGLYGAPPRTANGLAIASLVSGIVCCLPPLGLVFGLIALPQIKKKNQTGTGFAVTGIVLSSICCLLMILGLVSGAFGEAWKGFEKGMDEASRSQSAFALRTGQCYNVDGKLEAPTSDVKVVDCAVAHEGEVTGTFLLTGFTAWPGEKAIDRIAADRCEKIGDAYALDTWAIPDDVWTYHHRPSDRSWRAGDRTVACSFVVDGGDPIKGSLRSDGSNLDAGQVAFLRAVNPIDVALRAEPEEDADVDLASNTAWARQVRTALTGASTALKGRQWPAKVSAPVAAMVMEIDAAAEEWDELAKAADADAFWEHYDTAYDMTTWKSEPAARRSFGLTAESGPGTSV
ncbi:DUF4190 domain-containing protein [Streptomyces lateritius]|uniref:DUF4190 domain-containing protein n=1 Tax=Streptomyces lateritius TaxID=67313 RepID=UPI00167C0167|nr:DUF4190 domain-containing protein [Streptomyces lateritius]GGT82559.1 membrane protein [Streptomyces lateritius]